MYRIQEAPLDINVLTQELTESSSECGAIVTFTGRVRGSSEANMGVKEIYLESYPSMTNKAMMEIVEEVKLRWRAVEKVSIIHRVGVIGLCEPIVFVGVSSKHRKDSFEAASFIMDQLKTSVPLWKKENIEGQGWAWVNAKSSDKQAALRWY
ncbi:molybdenum cofactor biosynthesis protein MoaE [Salinivibrio sp. ML290]|uniref:molybdenum cofactor biosynthesis protein MoaE n=1 Tax=Salinivibrio sp. ML290 TaxID=1909468 RepID=UPI0018E3E7AA|nr:molybdenum cofactor biosynthesis protein MoaE [Salinivibrio sp. ML290]